MIPLTKIQNIKRSNCGKMLMILSRDIYVESDEPMRHEGKDHWQTVECTNLELMGKFWVQDRDLGNGYTYGNCSHEHEKDHE